MKVTEQQIGMLVELLSRAGEPVPARQLAGPLRVPGRAVESKRRRVREVVEAAHDAGHKICANERQGYWQARDDSEWAAYKAAREAKARFGFVRVRKMREAAGERTSRQGMLIDVRPSAVDLMPT